MWRAIKFSFNSFSSAHLVLHRLQQRNVDGFCYSLKSDKNKWMFQHQNFLFSRWTRSKIELVVCRHRYYSTATTNTTPQPQSSSSSLSPPPTTTATTFSSPSSSTDPTVSTSLNTASNSVVQPEVPTDTSTLAASQLAAVAATVAEGVRRWEPWTSEYYQHCTWFHFFSLPVEWLIDTFAAWGLPMWSAIFLGVLSIRGLLFPLTILQMRSALNLEQISRQMQSINTRTDLTIEERQQKLVQLFQEHGGLRVFAGPFLFGFAQLPVFVALFTAVAYMSGYWGPEWIRPRMFTEGIAIWQNLTLPDKTYVLPILNSALFIVFTFFFLNPNPNAPKATLMRSILLVLSLLFIPFTFHFPVALHVYFMALSLFSVGQGLLLRSERVRSFFGLSQRSVPIIKPSIVFDHKPTPSSSTTQPRSPSPPLRSSNTHSRRNK